MVCIRLFSSILSERLYQKETFYTRGSTYVSFFNLESKKKAISDSNQRGYVTLELTFTSWHWPSPLSGQVGTHSQALSLLSLQKNALKIICEDVPCYAFSLFEKPNRTDFELNVRWMPPGKGSKARLGTMCCLCTAFLFPLKAQILGMLVACLQIEQDLLLYIS